MTFDEFKRQREGKRYQESVKYWYQCVALAKLYASEVDWLNLNGFWWSAIQWWGSGSPFKGKPYTRVNYSWKGITPRGSIVFFWATKSNPYWHVAIAWQCSNTEIRVIEQNADKWSGTWLWGDAITIRNYPYSWWKVGSVLWWYTCTMQF